MKKSRCNKGKIKSHPAFQTPSRHSPDTLEATSRQPLETYQTPFGHPPDTLQVPSRHPLDTHKTPPNFSFIAFIEVPYMSYPVLVGRWGAHTYIIMLLRNPTCKLGLARIQMKLNSKRFCLILFFYC